MCIFSKDWIRSGYEMSGCEQKRTIILVMQISDLIHEEEKMYTHDM